MTIVDRLPSRRPLLLAFVFVLVAGPWAGTSSALAQYQAAPWCAAQGGMSSAWDCSYFTFEQCMATARGLSSNCAPNPRYIDKQARKRRAPR